MTSRLLPLRAYFPILFPTYSRIVSVAFGEAQSFVASASMRRPCVFIRSVTSRSCCLVAANACGASAPSRCAASTARPSSRLRQEWSLLRLGLKVLAAFRL